MDEVVVYVAERVGDAPQGVTLQAAFAWTRAGGYAGSFGTFGSGKSLRAADGYGADLLPDVDAAGRAGGQDVGCPTGSPCSLSSQTGDQGGLSAYAVGYPAGVPQPKRIYLVIRGHDLDVGLSDSPGWTLRRLTSARVQFVSARTDDASIQVAASNAEHFTSAAADALSGPSFALGSPPCRPAHRVGFAREGVGQVTLSGGRSPVAFSCSETGTGNPVAAALKATHWSLQGDVTGTATGPTRLLIVEV